MNGGQRKRSEERDEREEVEGTHDESEWDLLINIIKVKEGRWKGGRGREGTHEGKKRWD